MNSNANAFYIFPQELRYLKSLAMIRFYVTVLFLTALGTALALFSFVSQTHGL